MIYAVPYFLFCGEEGWHWGGWRQTAGETKGWNEPKKTVIHSESSSPDELLLLLPLLSFRFRFRNASFCIIKVMH